MTPHLPRRAAALLTLALAAPAAVAQGFTSFNHATFSRGLFVPATLGAAPLTRGAETRYVLDVTNESTAQGNNREALLLDAETLRLALHHRRAFGESWQWSAELPVIVTGGGVLDGLIEGWHDVFGLPNGNRDQRPQRRYRLAYERDGVLLVDRDEGHAGLGDARLGVARRLGTGWQLHAAAQLPTGSRSAFTGGAAGLAAWSHWQGHFGTSGVGYALAGGASVTDTGGPLGGIQRRFAPFGGAMLSVPVPRLAGWEGVVQLDAHAAPYRDSSLSSLGKAAVPITFGFRYRWQGGALDLAVAEDLSVNASPDLGLHLSVQVLR